MKTKKIKCPGIRCGHKMVSLTPTGNIWTHRIPNAAPDEFLLCVWSGMKKP